MLSLSACFIIRTKYPEQLERPPNRPINQPDTHNQGTFLLQVTSNHQFVVRLRHERPERIMQLRERFKVCDKSCRRHRGQTSATCYCRQQK